MVGARSWLGAVVALLLAMPATAQQAATDNELFAGYCFGVTSLVSFIGKAMALRDCDGGKLCLELREDGAKVQQLYESGYKRVNAYLKARGLFDERSNSPAWTGVKHAMDSGGEDFKACTGSGTGRNSDDQACARMRRCLDTSRLPM